MTSLRTTANATPYASATLRTGRATACVVASTTSTAIANANAALITFTAQSAWAQTPAGRASLDASAVARWHKRHKRHKQHKRMGGLTNMQGMHGMGAASGKKPTAADLANRQDMVERHMGMMQSMMQMMVDRMALTSAKH